MAAISATRIFGGLTYGSVNPLLGDELDELTEVSADPAHYFGWDLPSGTTGFLRIADNNIWGISGSIAWSWFDDFYERVYAYPQVIDLGTVASPQTRVVTVWNAYTRRTASLSDILINDGDGVSIDGPIPPVVMNPMQELDYELTVSTSGSPSIDASILFDFSDVPDPLPVQVIGTRAVRLGLVPEVPVMEYWEWLTDIQIAVTGDELRSAVRGDMPRVYQEVDVIATDEREIREFYSKLATCMGRLWMPQQQYATTATATSFVGQNRIYFDPGRMDVRDGEYLQVGRGEDTALVQVLLLQSDGAILSASLETDVRLGDVIVPGAPALIDNNYRMSRLAVNTVGTASLRSTLLTERTTLVRPGSEPAFTMYRDDLVLDLRPMANSAVPESFDTGQFDIDNNTGQPDIASYWKYTRISGEREWKINRIQAPTEMDWWKAFCSHARGRARMFWAPTWRPDLYVTGVVPEEASNIRVLETHYAQLIFPALPTHRDIEIETTAGVHRARVSTATVELDGTSSLTFSPALPVGPEWTQIARISYLLPVRLGSDTVTLAHSGLETILKLSLRTAEPAA